MKTPFSPLCPAKAAEKDNKNKGKNVDIQTEPTTNSAQDEQPKRLFVPQTDSTNKQLRLHLSAAHLPERSVLHTDFQTAGRGQVGNTWESEAGKNLTFSVVLYPTSLAANRQFLISQIAALSVKETLDAYTDGISVKWPNDVYYKDQKICGMLVENDLCGATLLCSIIGIGLNLNQALFRSNAPNPVSLLQITGKETDRTEVLDSFLARLDTYYIRLLREEYADIQAAYRSALYRGTGFHPYQDSDGIFEACIHEVEPTGHLLLQRKDKSIRRYAFKEVSIFL